MLNCTSCGRESPEEHAFCPACGAPLAAASSVRVVRKTVTVVFCDVTGSTALGERLDPESLREVQSRYFDAMRVPIELHGGTVEKYIGDAVMAVFGIPQLHEDDALRAVRAAVGMREALAALNEGLERDLGVQIAVRIGVNTGKVVAGDAITGQALVTGDAVNVAPRLEERAAPDEILIGEVTHRLVRAAVDAEAVEPVVLKGKARRVLAWRVLRVRDTATTAPRRLHSPMIGREPPLAQLTRAYEAAIEDTSCHLFTLLGSAGVGKSRLVEEFLSSVDEGAKILRGRCLPYGEGITYFPVVEAIKEASGLADFDLPEVVEAKVCSVLEGDEHQQVVCRHVAQLIGVAEPSDRDETSWAIRRFFEAIARDLPLVIVFDDIHWGEPTFLDLIEYIRDWSRSSPILLLCMARSELVDLRPTWGGGKLDAVTLSLEPLSEDQSSVLAANLLGSTKVPAELISNMIERAEGNPLFVEETLAMLIDDGFLVHDGEQWRATGDLSTVEVPSSIHALLAARLDHLRHEERIVLEAAAVVGKDFLVGAVGDLVSDRTQPQLRADLMGLVGKGLIQRQRATLPREDAFRFRHLLIRDAAYDGIAKARRAEMHERVADWLERTAGDAVLEQAEIVGYHLEQACLYRRQLAPPDERSDALGHRAAALFAAVGHRALTRGDFPAAVSLLERASLVGEQDGVDRAATLFHLAVALDGTGNIQEALASLVAAMRLAREGGDRSLEWLARIWYSELRDMADPHSTPTHVVRAELDEAIGIFEELGDEAGLATAWTKLALLDFMPCRFDHATRAARRAVEHARMSGDDRLFTDAVRFLLFSLVWGSSTVAEASGTLDGLTEDLGRTRSLEATVLAVRGRFQALEGSFEDARRLIRHAIEISESMGSGWIAVYEAFRGEVEFEAGDLTAAEAAHRRSYEILDQRGQEGFKSTAAANLAQILCALGRFDEADGYATIAITLAPDDDLPSQIVGRSSQAMVLASRGRSEDAERLARNAVQMLENVEAPTMEGSVRMDLARGLRMSGRIGEAAQVATAALASFERKGNRPLATSSRAFLDEVQTVG